MSAAAYLDRWLEDDALKAALSFDVAMDGMSPQEPGSALLMLWRSAQESCGRRAAICQVQGGPGALSDALSDAVRAAGGQVRTGAEVCCYVTRDDRVVGVALSSGEEITARAVVSGLDPKRTLATLGAELAAVLAQPTPA